MKPVYRSGHPYRCVWPPRRRESGVAALLSTVGTTVARLLRLVGMLLVQRPWPGGGRYARRLVVGAALLAVLVPLQALHWACLALDELLYPGYRRVAVRAPIFVLGTPRSGTTFLHRLLAHDPGLASFATWECAFAPSVLQRRCLMRLARLDARLGAPVGRLIRRAERRLTRALDGLHPTSLAAPEEDYLVLSPSFECFLLVVAFPEATWLWDAARLDERPAAERAAFAERYRRVLQRHLYAHGTQKRLLSKNAAFAGSVRTLAEAFPDARLLVCRRDPLDAIDSQMRVLAGARRTLGTDGVPCGLDERLIEAFRFWGANLATFARGRGARRAHRATVRSSARRSVRGTRAPGSAHVERRRTSPRRARARARRRGPRLRDAAPRAGRPERGSERARARFARARG